MAPRVSKQEVLDVMKRVGTAQLLDQASHELPDPVDIKRDQELLARYGVARSQLVDRLGGTA